MTVKKFEDLKEFKEEHVAQLQSIGINSVEELAAALADDSKVKEVIVTLSGVGPKTVESWKNALADVKESEVQIVEEEDEKQVYVAKAKPELSPETADGLAKRAVISGRRPAFKRQEWFRYAKLGESWRRPKGIHSKMKRNLKRRTPVVDVGFRGPVAVRDLHPSGFEEVLVHNIEGLEGVDPKTQAVRVGGTVGTKKRIAIQEKADELGIRVLNRMV